ncbi:MAG: hypothetical protein Q7T03_04210 [Deltaproteobacteria bacterium]|nr:hypothetical protein [Deltaproteobacteria bacterium]
MKLRIRLRRILRDPAKLDLDTDSLPSAIFIYCIPFDKNRLRTSLPITFFPFPPQMHFELKNLSFEEIHGQKLEAEKKVV